MGKGPDHKEKGGPQTADTLVSVNESHTVARIVSAAMFSMRYRLRLKKQCSINILEQFSTKHIIQQHYQPDGSIARDEINTWFALRIKKQLMKGAMEWHVFIINVNLRYEIIACSDNNGLSIVTDDNHSTCRRSAVSMDKYASVK
jgi:hypothetical protein